MKILISAILIVTVASAQSAMQATTGHSIPFTSSGNRIELSVENTSTVTLNSTEVFAENIPVWLKFISTKEIVKGLSSNESKTASFIFSADKSAPINKPHTLKFTILSSTGEQWTKEITLQVSPPEKFELFQNYPNPYNPSTTISYQLPVSNHVTLKVYDAIGREVATLVNELHDAGYYSAIFDASKYASGVYIYKLTSGKFSEVKKMILVK